MCVSQGKLTVEETLYEPATGAAAAELHTNTRITVSARLTRGRWYKVNKTSLLMQTSFTELSQRKSPFCTHVINTTTMVSQQSYIIFSFAGCSEPTTIIKCVHPFGLWKENSFLLHTHITEGKNTAGCCENSEDFFIELSF